MTGWKTSDKSTRYTFNVPELQDKPYINRKDDTLEYIMAKAETVDRTYREFDIPKRNGKVRHIKTPVGDLKPLQAWVKNYFQKDLAIMPHNCCHGFEKGRNCHTALKVHQANSSEWFMKLDIADFFPSITTSILYNSLRNIANCSKLDNTELDVIVSLLVDETGHMTQGCISSPYFSNLVLLEFDNKFTMWCNKRGLVYTRYADDMIVSSADSFAYRTVEHKVVELLPAGLRLNRDKTQYRNYKWHNFNLGLCYSQDKKITCGKDMKNLFKVIAHKLQLGDETIDTVLWKGRFNYYASIEPEYFSQPRFDIFRRL